MVSYTLSEHTEYQRIVKSPRWRVSDGFVRRSKHERSCFLMPSETEYHHVEALFVEDEAGARLYIARDDVVLPGSFPVDLELLERVAAGSEVDCAPLSSRVSAGDSKAIAYASMIAIRQSASEEWDREQAALMLVRTRGGEPATLGALSGRIFEFLTTGERFVMVEKRRRRELACPLWSPQRALVIRSVAEALVALGVEK